MLQYTEVQAGAIEQRQVIDQLFSVKSTIQYQQRKGKQTYLAFTHFEKVFGKTWNNGFFYNICKQGIKHKIWRVMTELKQNRNIRTLIRYGISEEITIQDKKGQGKVLLGPEFTSLVDETAVELRVEGMGVLLFMDDITIASEELSKVEKTIKFVRKLCDKWHLVMNFKKSKMMISNPHR